MRWPSPSQDDLHPVGPPRAGWSGPVAYLAQTAVLVLALLALMDRHRRAILESQSRIEAIAAANAARVDRLASAIARDDAAAEQAPPPSRSGPAGGESPR